MNLFVLAARNLLRHRRRSFMTIMAIIIGTESLLLFGGYSHGVMKSIETQFVVAGGHLQIQRKDFSRFGNGDPSAFGIRAYRQIVEAVKQDAELASMLHAVAPTLVFGGIAGNFNAHASRTVVGIGVDVEARSRFRTWNEHDIQFPAGYKDYDPLTGSEEDGAVIGFGLARGLRLCAQLDVPDCESSTQVVPPSTSAPTPSDIAALSDAETAQAQKREDGRIDVLAASTQGAPNIVSLNVFRAENLGNKEWDDRILLMRLPQAQRLIYGSSEPEVTAIMLQLKHTAHLAQARARLQKVLAERFAEEQLEIQDFAALNPAYGQTVGFMDGIFRFMAVLMSAIVLFTVGNTMNTAVIERTVEIGTLRALGLRQRAIRRMFLCEGLLLGLVGVCLGVIFSFLIAFAINHSKLSYVPPGRVDSVPYTVMLWGANTPSLIFATSVGLVAVVVFSAWWPARGAARTHIVDALRRA